MGSLHRIQGTLACIHRCTQGCTALTAQHTQGSTALMQACTLGYMEGCTVD